MIIDIEHTEIKNMVLKCIDEGKSAFVLRMGDGEMRIQREHESLGKFSIKQFGRKMTTEEIEKAKVWLRDSVLESSILGLPTKDHCDASNLWSFIIEYYGEMRYLYPDSWDKKRYCSINSHYELLASGDLFDILSKVERIVVVSSRDIEERLKNRFNNIKEVEAYTLPGEQIFELEKNLDIDIFKRIEEICYAISSKKRTGELLIFGAGPIGKIIGAEFSKSGGVAIDLGSVFDFFVGKVTRGPGKGPNSKMDPVL